MIYILFKINKIRNGEYGLGPIPNPRINLINNLFKK